MASAEHQTGCVLFPVHWLRHAIAASGRLANPSPEDRLARPSSSRPTASGEIIETMGVRRVVPDLVSKSLAVSTAFLLL